MAKDYQYEMLLKETFQFGSVKEDRTGTGTVSGFGGRLRYNLSQGLPVVTSKQVHLKSVIHELLWFISGDTNVKYLVDNGVRIWNEWAREDGSLGPTYGHQLRNWNSEGIDQLQDVIDSIRSNPDSRRHIINLWNPGQVDEMELPPCHGVVIQFYVADGKVSCQMYQRSADLFLGVPFNITFYSILTHMIADQTGYDVGDFIWIGGDCHIYSNHMSQVAEQLGRDVHEFPSLKLTSRDSIDDYKFEDIVIENYTHEPKITAPVAI